MLTANYEIDPFDGNDLYLELSGGKDVAFFTNFPLYVGLKAGYFDADWIGKKGISDINIEVSTSLVNDSYVLSPRFVVTYVPMDEVNPDHLIVWSGLSITKVIQ